MNENKYTLDEIIHLTGIPQARAIEVCRMLCSEGYLLYDQTDGKYCFTSDQDKRKRFQQVKEKMTNDQTAGEMYAKIENIMTFSKPLALSDLRLDRTIKDIGVPGLNVIFGTHPTLDNLFPCKETSGKTTGLPRGHCILVKGAPGTGKTTLGMQMAIQFHDQRSLFLTFEEDVDQLCKNLEVYCRQDEFSKVGWEKSAIKKVTRSILKVNTPMIWEDPEAVLQELITTLDKEIPLLVVIDSISRLRDIGGESKCRLVLRRLIRTLKIRHITSILLGEDCYDGSAFEDYEVDGVIRLGWIKEQLSLTVEKMRGMRAYKGPHSAVMLTVHDVKQDEHHVISEDNLPEYYRNNPGAFYLKPGFNVFPEISVYKELRSGPDDADKEKTPLGSGISGLDDLLQTDEPVGKGFRPGEAILINGSAGAGKTLIGLSFMNEGFLQKDSMQPKKKIGVWFSYEGDEKTLEKAVQGFKKQANGQLFYATLFASMKETDNEEGFFKFFNFPPLNLDFNKIVYTIEALRGKYIIDRLVIDSITELERAKGGGQPEVKTFLAGLIQYLRKREITTVFISRTDTFFRSIDKIEEQVSSLVDLIICIRNFDMRNQIHRGIYIQKARGRKHNSKILRMTIDPEKGIDVEDRGWDVENLLAGDASNIQGPKVFFKLFYENLAEKDINEAIIKDFDLKRYPGEDGPKFGAVRKSSIYTEFWSFKGQYSSGHANTRVLSIPDYIANALRDKDRLDEIDKYVKADVMKKLENEETLVNRYADKKNDSKKSKNIEDKSKWSGKTIDAVPSYLDYGVMVYRGKTESNPLKDFAKELSNILKDWQQSGYNEMLDIEKKLTNKTEYNWKSILSMIPGMKTENKIIPFAFPPLDKKAEFVAFFLELLWSHGGDIFDSAISLKKESPQYPEVVNIFENKLKISILKEVMEGDVKRIMENKDDLSKKFSSYGIINRFKEKVDDFLNWIREEQQKISGSSGDIKVILDDAPFKETIKLMLELVYKAKVKNPIHGEFRHRAVLARVWYSQVNQLKKEQCELNSCPFGNTTDCQWINTKDEIQKKNKTESPKPKTKMKCFEQKCLELQGEYRLLPLPLAAIPGTGNKDNNEAPMYRSITCLTYWSLVMLKNALSPEIGGNFIESMNSPEYFERRLKDKTGMPVTEWEIDKEKYIRFDPESYAILGQTFENDKARIEIAKKYKNGGTLEVADSTFINDDEFQKITGKKELKEKSSQSKEEKTTIKVIEEIEKKLNERVFFSRVRQSRTAFYLLEEALHYQLTQLFIEKEHLRDENLYDGKYIVKNIKDACNNDASLDINSTIFDDISREFRTHAIFELLIYFYSKEREKK